MNQTRTFLIVAWLMVVVLLWMEWNKEKAAPPPQATVQTLPAGSGAAAVPVSPPAGSAGTAGVPDAPTVPQAPGVIPESRATPTQASAVQVETDVLRLVIDGGSVLRAELLDYPQTRDEASPPVLLFDSAPQHYYAAQSGWASSGPAPNHEQGFVPAGDARSFVLSPGQDELVVPFVWRGPDGVEIRRSYVLTRGQYAIGVRDQIVNQGSQPWQGYPYRQLLRG